MMVTVGLNNQVRQLSSSDAGAGPVGVGSAEQSRTRARVLQLLGRTRGESFPSTGTVTCVLGGTFRSRHFLLLVQNFILHL